MVNVAALLVPLLPLTVMLRVPAAADAETEKVAVICVALTTFTFEIVMSGALELIAAPAAKLKPLMVTPRAVPTLALFGLILLINGVDGSTVVDAPALPPA